MPPRQDSSCCTLNGIHPRERKCGSDQFSRLELGLFACDCYVARPINAMEYKDTLNLPRTDFAMKADLVTREPERLKKWEAADLYAQIQAARKDAEKFVLH